VPKQLHLLTEDACTRKDLVELPAARANENKDVAGTKPFRQAGISVEEAHEVLAWL
jgi:hypothetical protein